MTATKEVPRKEDQQARKRLDKLRKQAVKVVQGELIGKSVEAIPHKGGKGIKGTIVDETRDTLVIEQSKSRRVRVVKKEHAFEFHDGNRRIRVNGALIARRPEDRLKIKVRW